MADPYTVSPPNTTNYTTSVTDANGCTQTLNESKTLVVHELPVVDVSGTTEICNEEITQIYFDLNGLSHGQYLMKLMQYQLHFH